MTALYLNIEAKHRQNPGFLASIKDFTLSEGEAIDAKIILSSPNISLYCFDDEAKRAIFVELPQDVNLASVPFVYATQYEEAQCLIAVSYDSFREIAASLPPVENLIMIYITGRSGSTLLCNVLNELDSVMCLSEPDVITQFVHLRADNKARDAELRELFDCTVRILFKPNPYKTPLTYALKFRTETLRVMDLFWETFPQTKNLFLYRDCTGFVASFYRVFKNSEMPEFFSLNEFIVMFTEFFHYDFTPLRAYLDPNKEQVSLIQYSTFWWMMGMEWYLAQANKGISILAVSYADLNASREQVLSAIFSYCDLPVDAVSKTLIAFERDSQAGSFLARENPNEGNKVKLTDEQYSEISHILEQHPIIKQSDFIAPNSLHV